MTEEIARHRCVGEDGATLTVIQYRHVFATSGDGSAGQERGTARLMLLGGEPVRYVDAQTFEVIATGESIAHDIAQCDCRPAPKFTSSVTQSELQDEARS